MRKTPPIVLDLTALMARRRTPLPQAHIEAIPLGDVLKSCELKAFAGGRESVLLPDVDLAAGWLILSWIAWPHRPKYGLTLLKDWALWRAGERGSRISKKPNRLNDQLAHFDEKVREALEAGEWLRQRILSAEQHTAFAMDRSTRWLGRNYASLSSESNVIRDVWSHRKRVIHLSSAALTSIEVRLAAEKCTSWSFARLAFNPDWVRDTVESAELWGYIAAESGVIEPALLLNFCRDTF